MKKFLLATSALVMTSGFAAAEVSFSGAAGFGLQYNSETTTDTVLLSTATFFINMSGETDGGLTFGADMGIDVDNNGDLANDDTTVYIEGAFGKLSFGAVGEADEQGGISDVGWDGLDVDDVAEATTGDEPGDIFGVSLSHNVNYTYSADNFRVSFSTLVETDNSATNSVETYAIGGRYTFGDYYVGLGYAQHNFNLGLGSDIDNAFVGDFAGGDDIDSSIVSAHVGGTFDAFKVAAVVAVGTHSNETFGNNEIESTGFGVSASYTMDALTLSAAYGQTEYSGNLFLTGNFELTEEAYGIGASYDLGGGASISGGIARIESFDENQGDFGNDTETRADLGMSFSF